MWVLLLSGGGRRAVCGRFGVAERGWAGRLLVDWRWQGARLQVSEISAGRYLIWVDPHEVTAWCEVREPGGRRRCEVGSFPSVAAAKAGCERDAQSRCRREDAHERPPVGVAIGRARGGAPRGNRNAARRGAGKLAPAQAGGRELPAANYRPRDCNALPDLDAALAAFAGVIADEG